MRRLTWFADAKIIGALGARKKPVYLLHWKLIMPALCRSGGIGRRGGFKIRFPQGSGGSSPFSGTTFSGSAAKYQSFWFI